MFQLQENQKSCWRAPNLTILLSLLAKKSWWILSLLLAIPSKLRSPHPHSGTAKRKLNLVDMHLNFLTVFQQTLRNSGSSWQSSVLPPSVCVSAASPSTTRASTDWRICTHTAKHTRWADHRYNSWLATFIARVNKLYCHFSSEVSVLKYSREFCLMQFGLELCFGKSSTPRLSDSCVWG